MIRSDRYSVHGRSWRRGPRARASGRPAVAKHFEVRMKTTINITNDYNFVTIFPYNVNNFLPYIYL